MARSRKSKSTPRARSAALLRTGEDLRVLDHGAPVPLDHGSPMDHGAPMDHGSPLDHGIIVPADHGRPSGSGGTSVRPYGHPWPPFDKDGEPVWPGWPLLGASKFPRRYWDSYRYALVVMAEFSTKDWQSIDVQPYPSTDEEVKQEIKYLVELGSQRERAVTLAEVLAQAESMEAYWLGMLMFSRGSHPATFDLVNVALRVGQFVGMHFKARFNRPRPAQISPAITPWIDTPGHPSYPSGHALEGHLISLCLNEVMSGANEALTLLARRVALNREIAGLHYPSDTACGIGISGQVMPLLMQCQLFRELIFEARTEWGRR